MAIDKENTDTHGYLRKSASKESSKIGVLVIDDSLFMRRLISDMLNSDPKVKVIDTARNGKEALNKLSEIKPDCITLDLVMPDWDGLTTLKHIMATNPTPVIILSAYSKRDADITIKCLNAGAVSFVLKPSGELSLDIENVKHQLLEQVKATSKINVRRIKTHITEKPRRVSRKFIGINNFIVIGASTGGPQTLELILSHLPSGFSVPIIVVQHMPSEIFTESLAEHLNRISELEIKVAEDGEVVFPGRVYIAPAEFQTRIISDNLRKSKSVNKHGLAYIRVSKAEPDSLSPSIDITMKSAAEVYNGSTTGVILTGMGHDGVEGAKAIKESGGKIVAQDESSLIFGMPKVVIDAGYADKALPASEIADEMMNLINTNQGPN